MFFTSKTNDTYYQNREPYFFHMWEIWHVQSETTVVNEFRAKIPAFYRPLQLEALCKFSHLGHAMKQNKLLSKDFFQFLLVMKISPYLVYTLSIQTFGGFNPVPYMSHIVGVLNFP